MADFRARFYGRYVSEFKREEARPDPRALESYWRWCEHKFLPLLDGLAADEPILELGCGPGRMLEFLGRRGFSRVEGVDLSAEQVALAAERGLNAQVADALEVLDGARERWGAILALDFIEHFAKDELVTLAARLHDALRPGGRLILQTPNGAGLFPHQVIHGDLTHLTIFTAGSLEQLLRLAGFGEFRFAETGPAPIGLRGRARVALWRLIRVAAGAVRAIETGKRPAIWTENLICCCRRPAR